MITSFPVHAGAGQICQQFQSVFATRGKGELRPHMPGQQLLRTIMT
jgi:hypothetical protein